MKIVLIFLLKILATFLACLIGWLNLFICLILWDKIFLDKDESLTYIWKKQQSNE